MTTTTAATSAPASERVPDPASRSGQAAPLEVWFALTPNLLLLDYAGPAEALRIAARMGAGLRLHSCAARPSLPTSVGVELSGLAPLPPRLPPHSLVILAGTVDEVVDHALPEARAVVDWLATAPREDTLLASVCSGALLLARAGRLAGRRCTTHYSLTEELRRLAPDSRVEDDRLFIDDGPVLTSAGITTGIDLALYLIERHCGPAMAAAVARRMVVFMRRSGHDPQLSPWLAWRNHLHPAVHRVQDVIARDPTRRWTLAELAERAHVSPRHLTRLFAAHAGVGITEYQQRLRLACVRGLLADRRLSLERIAEKTGFGSARDLRRVWARHEAEALPQWRGRH